MYIRAAILIAGTLILGILAGCGGGSDSRASNASSNAESGSAEAGSTEQKAEGEGEAQSESEPEGGAEPSESQSGEGTAGDQAFVRTANQVCEANGQRLSKEAFTFIGKYKGSESAAEVAVVGAVVTPVLETERDKLSALSVPAEDQEAMSEVLAGYEEVIKASKSNPAKFVKQNSPYVAIEKPANAMGLTACPL